VPIRVTPYVAQRPINAKILDKLPTLIRYSLTTIALINNIIIVIKLLELEEYYLYREIAYRFNILNSILT